MKKRNLNAPTTLRDLDDLETHIITAINKTLEDYPTKDDLKNEIKRAEDKIDYVASDVSDIRRRVIDLEIDTVGQREFKEFKAKVLPT